MAKNTTNVDLFADNVDLNENTPATPEAGSPAPAPVSGFVIDFAAVELVQKPVPANLYHAVITSATPTFAQSSGNPMINLRYKISEGEYEGRTITDRLVFTQPTGDWNKDYPLRKIRETLEAIGYNPAEHGGVVDPEALLGEAVTIGVRIEDIKRNGSITDPESGEAYGKQNAVARILPYGKAQTVDSIL